MPKNATVNKRVKRHVIGKVHSFFAVAAPAVRTLCEKELGSLLAPDPLLEPRPGGIRFSARLNDVYRINLMARFASRVLMALTSFQATGFGHLENKIAAFPWELFLYAASPLHVRVHTSKCRLYHTAAVAERILKRVADRLADFGLPAPEDHPPTIRQQLFVRGEHDHFSVSIDSSGEHLYKRGIKTHGGAAPLRENLAAAALEMAGYDITEPLLDPMCGSGTFSLEAAMKAANIPPGWFRQFAFMQWPSFISKRWLYLRGRMESAIRHPAAPSIFASDIDSRACDRLQACIDRHALAGLVKVAEQDFFTLAPLQWTPHKGLIVLNPPYGRRIEPAASAVPTLSPIADHLRAFFGGWRLALIAPREQLASVPELRLRAFPLSHGGLPVAVGVGRIP